MGYELFNIRRAIANTQFNACEGQIRRNRGKQDFQMNLDTI